MKKILAPLALAALLFACGQPTETSTDNKDGQAMGNDGELPAHTEGDGHDHGTEAHDEKDGHNHDDGHAHDEAAHDTTAGHSHDDGHTH